MLSNISKMAISMPLCVVHVTIFSTGGKFRLVSSFYLVARSYSSCPFLCTLVTPITPSVHSSSLHPLVDLGMSVMNWIESCDWQYNAHSGSSHDNESSYSLSESCDMSSLQWSNICPAACVSSSVSTWDSLSVGTKAHGHQRKTRKNCWNLGDI